MAVTSSGSISLQLNDYRGLSAYEIAVQNGFDGSETEWLASLKGEPGAAGDQITVNRKRAVDGNVSVNGTDIYLYAGMQDKTVTQAIEQEAEAREAVNKTANAKAEIYSQKVSLPAANWEQDGDIHGQSVDVDRITADENKTAALVTPPADREMAEAYLEAQVRAAAQGDGVIAFTCTELPEIDLEANVMVVVLGVPGE